MQTIIYSFYIFIDVFAHKFLVDIHSAVIQM